MIVMSEKEEPRLGVMSKVKDKRISQKMAGEVLGLSERQVRRLLRVYEKEGPKGLTHKRRGRPSNRRTEEVF
jgi:transposase